MRSKANENGVSVKTYAGTTGVLLGMNVEPRKWEGLLGFALERLDGSSGEKEWLKAIVPFPGTEREPGELFATNVAPVQRFRWSDYRVYPDTEYAYTVHSVYGSPAEPTVGDGPTVAVRTADPGGAHGVLFNRAAAASQAFSRRFPQVEAELDAARAEERDPSPLPEEALRWLSRGVFEQIVRFTEWAVDPTWALDVAIYEYELPEIVEAVNAARARGQGACGLPRQGRRRADRGERAQLGRSAARGEAGADDEQDLPPQVHGAEQARGWDQEAPGRALRLDELHPQWRLQAGQRRARGEARGRRPRVPRPV